MAVYVDRAMIPYRRMIMCHMIADTETELHAMADLIGVKRKWFQSQASFPHYDICKRKRELAIANGAVELNRKELVEVMRRLRGARTCIGCGCTDDGACWDESSGRPCHWLRLDDVQRKGVCSCCEQHLEAWDAGDRDMHVPL